MYSILVVEADRFARSATISALNSAGFNTLQADNYSHALATISSATPSAALIDYELPDGSGLELFFQLQQNELKQRVPTIILGPCCNEEARIISLEKGADDVVTKPISLNELILRLNNILHKSNHTQSTSNVSSNGISLDMQSLQVTIGGENTDLSLSEFRLLYHFMRNPNKAFSRNELRSLTKGNEAENKLNERSIDVYVMRLRKSLQQRGYNDLIKTVRGIGYRFTTDVKRPN